ncbi:MAG: flagellar biosynthesis anti-sigma factor FlgM [Methylobacter sp.]|nr:flagellar biosynthesis anti-sigma factor FlgM [Methylobacter sp.]
MIFVSFEANRFSRFVKKLLAAYLELLNKPLKFFTVLPIQISNEKIIKEFNMAIEINGRMNSPAPLKTIPKAEVDGEKKVAAPNAKIDDSVALTSTTQEIKKAFGSSSASPVDIDKVNSIKKALADGSYQADAEKVAKKMIQLEKLMPQENST